MERGGHFLSEWQYHGAGQGDHGVAPPVLKATRRTLRKPRILPIPPNGLVLVRGAV